MTLWVLKQAKKKNPHICALKEIPGSYRVQNTMETDGLDSFDLGQQVIT